jgi:uncharacterized protein
MKDIKNTRDPLTLEAIRLKTPETAKKIESTLEWLLSRSWSDEIQFIILYGSVSQGYARYNSDIDLVIRITGNKEHLTLISKELILKKPYDDLDIRLFDLLPIYIQKDAIKGLILYCQDKIKLYDLAYVTIKKYQAFKPYLDDYIGEATLP